MTDESKARQVAEFRQVKEREGELQKTSRVSLEDLSQRMRAGEVKELKVIVKGDVLGSVEALSAYLRRLSTAEVKVDVIHASAGGISETDVSLAAASGAIIIGFNVRPEHKAAALAESESVDIRLYTVIYDAINEMREAMEGMLAPTYREKSAGTRRGAPGIQRLGLNGGGFDGPGRQDYPWLAGASGPRQPGGLGRKVGSLRRFKDDVREVLSGYECGIGLENYNDVKPNDVIESFETGSGLAQAGCPRRSRCKATWRLKSSSSQDSAAASAGATFTAWRGLRLWLSEFCVLRCSCRRIIRSRASVRSCGRSRIGCATSLTSRLPNPTITTCGSGRNWAFARWEATAPLWTAPCAR